MDSLLRPVATLWQREIVRFYRQRSRIVGALATPILFWLVLGAGFADSFRPADAPASMGYAEYFFPGVLVLVILFTAIFSTISVIEDRKEGFLQAVLVAPVPRSAILLGKILGGTTLALGQAVLLLPAAPLVGIHLGPGDLLAAIAVLFVLAFGLTALGFMIAWRMESTQGFHAIMNLFLIPMWLLSGAFFPVSGASAWLKPIMWLNPLTYGLAALRHCLYPAEALGTVDMPAWGASVAIMCVFATLVFGIARRQALRPLDAGLA